MAKLAEPVTQRIVNIIQQGMPAAVLKIVTEYNDAIPMPVPSDQGYLFGERQILPEFPVVVVEADQSTIDAERFSNVWAVYDHQIFVDVILTSDTEAVLDRMVLRYARAIWEILYGNQDLTAVGAGTAAISVRPHTGTKSALVRDKNGALYKGWRWVLEIHRYDDLT